MKEFEYLEDGAELPHSLPEEAYLDSVTEAEYEDSAEAEYPEESLISYSEESASVFPADEDAYAAEFSEEYVDIPEVPDSYHDTYSTELFPEEDVFIPVDQTEITPAEDAVPAEDEDFHQIFRMEEKSKKQAKNQVPSPRPERPTRKGRPARRKGDGLLGIPHMIAVVIWLLIILAIGVSLGRIIWVCAADVLAFGRESKEVSVSITSDDTMDSIAEKLHDAGLIRYKDLFLLYLDLTDAEEEGKITTGTFTLNTIYDYHALVSRLGPRASNRVVIEDVLIPEGYSCRQIFMLLEEKGICKAADLEAYAATGELDDYWFLEGVERGDKYCLEGFLFPDTYDFYENSSPRQALEKMLDGFAYRITEDIYSQLPTLNARLSAMMEKNGCNASYIAEHQLDLRQLLTVASLIEEETSNNKESFKIASVIYNRLTQDTVAERYLNIDAAIFYALGAHKEALTAEDLQIDSPYNTYKYSGLVPGPISNPGLASIRAALDPEDTSYYYYILDPEAGEHSFSKTLKEHEEKRAKWYGN